MSEYYQQEGPQTIEQVFHPLRTRLFNIEQGKIKKSMGFLWREEDEEESNEDMIKSIVNNVFSLPALSSVKEIEYLLGKTDDLNRNLSSIIERAEFSEFVFAGDNEDEKAKAMKLIGEELNFYATKLDSIKGELEKRLNDAGGKPQSIKEDGAIELPNNIKFKPVPDGQTSTLDKYQSALLFHFLREKGAIKEKLSDSALAQIIFLLTGHSEPNIRQQALRDIWGVMDDKVKNKNNKDKNHNLATVANLLESILSDIRQHMKKKK